ncbi:MAG: internal scaffolding protein [Microviridae sp.]|nr:MAG: internal scaffolding protein [Microviridae sp.]
MLARQQYDVKADRIAREHCDITCLDESKTLQAPAVDADLNVIVARFGIKDVPVIPIDESLYGDVSDLPDLRAVLDMQRAGEAAFMSMPAWLRARFGNSMVEFYEFMQDPDNTDEAVRLGLAKKREEPAALPPVPPVVLPTSSERIGGPGGLERPGSLGASG